MLVQEQFHDPVFAGIGPLELQEITINDERWLCFTEEWIEGRVLTDMILDGPLSPQRLARLGLDLIHAVCLLSSRHFVHRDIKPANIMWGQRRDGFVLLDPGIALDQLGPSLTLGPMAVGTVAYQSPEQMDTSRKRSLDFRSDLFAVGLVLYEAAAARHPFMDNRATLSSVVAGILTRTPPSLAASIDTFPQELSNVIDRLLAKEPHLRYRTCERALAATAEASRLIGTTS